MAMSDGNSDYDDDYNCHCNESGGTNADWGLCGDARATEEQRGKVLRNLRS